MKLNARQVVTAKPKEKSYKLTDGEGCISKSVPVGRNTGVWNTAMQRAGLNWRTIMEDIEFIGIDLGKKFTRPKLFEFLANTLTE